MDSSFDGLVLDPSKCSKLSMDEKRQLVYELSKRQHGATEMLQSWSRQEILQILCAEMGKERKYTGLKKVKIIENLLKIVSGKNTVEREQPPVEEHEPQSSLSQGISKRQRKNDHPSRFTIPTTNDAPVNQSQTFCCCKNVACRATLRQEDTFCKRCSCCICYQYDDNKDPSLWLSCSSEPPFEGGSCGMSCHLECAFKHEKSGIGIAKGKDKEKDRRQQQHIRLDGSFNCVSCGKLNDLLGCWRKQMMLAKDTRRVDVLCYRVFLGQRLLLNGCKKLEKVCEIVDEAVEKLEGEVGPLGGVPMKMGRGIVNRLSSGPDVQKLCSFALESLDELLVSDDATLRPSPSTITQDSTVIAPMKVSFEDVSANSLTVVLSSVGPTVAGSIVGYTVRHRAEHDNDYPLKPTCVLFFPNPRFVITGLIPATKYYIKVASLDKAREMGITEVGVFTAATVDEVPDFSVTERSQSPATNCSSLSNPSSVEDESNNGDQNNVAKKCVLSVEGGIPTDGLVKVAVSAPVSDVQKLESKLVTNGRSTEVDLSKDYESDTAVQIPQTDKSGASLPITPSKSDIPKDCHGRNGRLNLKPMQNRKTGEPQDGTTSKKRSNGNGDMGLDMNLDVDGDGDGVDRTEFDGMGFEHYVKVIRWLEREGHIGKNFRQKFLTWYSMRATLQEVRVVKVFVDTFMEDPASLAEQLVDTFTESISSKQSAATATAVVPAGFCMKLWH